MNHQPQEHCHTNHDTIAHNTRSKRRATRDVIPPPPNQASTLGPTSHIPVMNAQQKKFPQ